MKTKIYSAIALILTLCLFLTGCGNAAAPQSTNDGTSGTISISGAFALYPMVTRWAEEYHALYPSVIFDISAGGAGKGMTDVLSDAVDIGMVSRSIRPEETEKGAFGVAVVKDAVFPVVNAGNPVVDELLKKGITQDTLTKIFITGEITTWGRSSVIPR